MDQRPVFASGFAATKSTKDDVNSTFKPHRSLGISSTSQADDDGSAIIDATWMRFVGSTLRCFSRSK